MPQRHLVYFISQSHESNVVSAVRLGITAPKPGKVSIMITESHDLWIGNLTDSPIEVKPGELAGFGTGAYTAAVVSVQTA